MRKTMNADMVGDESKMGFGQVLPSVLFIQILFDIVDIWKGKSYLLVQVSPTNHC